MSTFQLEQAAKTGSFDPIAITGLGPVSSLGVGVSAFSTAILSEAVPSADAREGFRGIEGFDVENFIELKTRCLDVASGMALAATALAIKDAGWHENSHDPTRTGLVLGTAYGNSSVLSDYIAANKVSPLRFVHTFINTPAGLASQALTLRGVHAVLCSGRAASLQAIRYACHLLNSRKADRVLCGGVDSLRFCGTGTALSRTVRAAGQEIGEGAGIVALQRNGDAPGRSYATVVGIGAASDQVLGPCSFVQALRKALEVATVDPTDVDSVVLATSWKGKHGDSERTAMLNVGISSDRWLDLASRTGEIGAAQGGLSTITASLMLASGRSYRHIAVMSMDRNQCVAVLLRGDDRAST